MTNNLLRISVVAITLATTVLFSAEKEEEDGPKKGFGIGPGMVVAGNIPIGQEISPGLEFEVHNFSKAKRKLLIRVMTPSVAGVISWEKGYEAIPDASWCKLDKEEIEAAPESITKVKASFKFPNDPGLLNRKYMVAVALENAVDPKASGAGFNLRMVSRLGVETSTNDDLKGEVGSLISLIPSILRNNAAKAGKPYNATFKIRNNRKEKVIFTPKSLKDVELDPEKHERYVGTGRTPVMDKLWIAPVSPIELNPGETKTISLTVNVPSDLVADKVFEELLFLEDQSKRYEFVRVRTSIANE